MCDEYPSFAALTRENTLLKARLAEVEGKRDGVTLCDAA